MHTGGDRIAGSEARIRLFIVTPIRLYRDGLAHFLRSSDRVSVLGAAAEERQTIDRVAELLPDVVLLDMTLDRSRETARSLRRVSPMAAIVALAVPDSGPHIVSCAEAGVAGYVSRDASLDELLAAIVAAHIGEAVCSPQVAAQLLRRIAALVAESEPTPIPKPGRLTPREGEVLALIDQGLSNQQIARTLHIGLPTAKNHVHSILDKLGAQSRSEAVAVARRSVTAIG